MKETQLTLEQMEKDYDVFAEMVLDRFRDHKDIRKALRNLLFDLLMLKKGLDRIEYQCNCLKHKAEELISG